MRWCLVGDGAAGPAKDFPARCCAPISSADGAAFAGKTVFAFAGIGRPEKFVASLEDSGADVTGSCFFDDHHPYTEDEITQLKTIAGEAMLVTTEKDFVRLTAAEREGIRVLKVAALFDDPAGMDGLLDRACAPALAPP